MPAPRTTQAKPKLGHGRGRPAGSGSTSEGHGEFDPAGLVRAVQAEVFPFERNYFRTGAVLSDAVGRLDVLWENARHKGASSRAHIVKAREAAAMLATARWMYRSALARTETRGMHRGLDHLQQDPSQRAYLTVGGLDEIHISARPAPALPPEVLAA